MINDNTAVTILKSKGIYCIECSIINEYTANQIKDIVNLYRINHLKDKVCVITKNTDSMNEEGLDILCNIDNLIIRLSSVYNENILSKCNKTNLQDLLTASLYTPKELKRINYKIDNILSKINPNWSKSQIAIYIYNYIMSNTKYDPEFLDKESFATRSLRAFLSHKTICAGYSYMYKELMDRLNIPCEYLIGKVNDGGHAWNSITLNGKTYYCDLTWDSHLYKTDTNNEQILKYFAQDVEKFEKNHKPFHGFERSYTGKLSSMTDNEKKKLLSSVMSYSENYNFESFERSDGSVLKVAKIGLYDEFSPDSARSLQAYITFNVTSDSKISLPSIYLTNVDLDREKQRFFDLITKREEIKKSTNLTELEKTKKIKEIYNSILIYKKRYEIINEIFSKNNMLKRSQHVEQYLGGIKDNEYFYDKSNENRKIRTRILRRSNGTPIIIIDSFFKTKVSDVNLNSYNILTLSKEQDKFNISKYKVLTENDLFTIKRSSFLSDCFLSEQNLKNRNTNSQGYLGFIKDDKWYYHSSVDSILNKSILSYSVNGSLSINVNHM